MYTYAYALNTLYMGVIWKWMPVKCVPCSFKIIHARGKSNLVVEQIVKIIILYTLYNNMDDWLIIKDQIHAIITSADGHKTLAERCFNHKWIRPSVIYLLVRIRIFYLTEDNIYVSDITITNPSGVHTAHIAFYILLLSNENNIPGWYSLSDSSRS